MIVKILLLYSKIGQNVEAQGTPSNTISYCGIVRDVGTDIIYYLIFKLHVSNTH
jgi:hypothetical protein